MVRRKRGRFVTALVWLVLIAGVLVLRPAVAAAKYASLVVDAGSGEVLHAVNADVRNYPASLTKLMTLYMLFEALEDGRITPTTPMRVSATAAAQPPSKLGLPPGQTIRVRDAILALVVRSANDIAVVAAEHLGGSERRFAEMMTDRARALGMSRTTFRNASGLPDQAQLSTARDMATLARVMLQRFPQHYRVFSTRSFTYAGVTHRTHNRLLASYAGLDGMKTGYIRASGYNLVASAERGGRRLIGVVFGGQSSQARNLHMASLLDKGFEKAGTTVLVRQPAAGSWAVQVGAFIDRGSAAETAGKALAQVRGLNPGAFVHVERSQRSAKGPLYLARVVNTGREEAYRSCQVLKQKRFQCLVVRLSEPVSAPAARPVTAATMGAPVPRPRAEVVSAGAGEAEIVVPAPAGEAGEADVGDGGWGVQVGAFRERQAAVRTAEATAADLPALNDGSVVIVRHVNSKRRAYYLARIHGLARTAAYGACAELEDRNRDCLVIRTPAALRSERQPPTADSG